MSLNLVYRLRAILLSSFLQLNCPHYWQNQFLTKFTLPTKTMTREELSAKKA